jgi:hypothetical protein
LNPVSSAARQCGHEYVSVKTISDDTAPLLDGLASCASHAARIRHPNAAVPQLNPEFPISNPRFPIPVRDSNPESQRTTRAPDNPLFDPRCGCVP